MKRLTQLLALSACLMADVVGPSASARQGHGLDLAPEASTSSALRGQLLAQNGPLILPGAALPSEPVPAAPQDALPAKGKGKGNARPGKAAAAPPPPPEPVPEALPGFEHLAPPPPPPKPSVSAAQAAKDGLGLKQPKLQEPEPPPAAWPSEQGYVPETPPVRIITPTMKAKPGEVVLQPMDLSDAGLLTRRRLTLADPTLTTGAVKDGSRSRTVKTGATPTVRPLYPIMAFVPGMESVYESQVVQADSFDLAPLALNSVEAMRDGVPVGPFRAGMIEENPQGAPRIETGTVVWQVDGGTAMSERGPDAIRATAVMGKSQTRVELSIRNQPGADGAAPLSIELRLRIPGDRVVQAGLPELRNSGIDRGVALYASVAGEGENIVFVFQDNASDGEQNVRLLTSRSWIDIPVRLASGRRVVIALERGTAVRDMMRDSFRLWRLPWLP